MTDLYVRATPPSIENELDFDGWEWGELDLVDLNAALKGPLQKMCKSSAQLAIDETYKDWEISLDIDGEHFGELNLTNHWLEERWYSFPLTSIIEGACSGIIGNYSDGAGFWSEERARELEIRAVDRLSELKTFLTSLVDIVDKKASTLSPRADEPCGKCGAPSKYYGKYTGAFRCSACKDVTDSYALKEPRE